MNLRTAEYFSSLSKRNHGFMMVDLFVGMVILAVAILPLAFSYVRETRLLRAEYFRGTAMEIVDGEMEVLAAGEWRDFSEGSQPYTVHAHAATNFPPGHFQLTKTGNHLRLEWTSDNRQGIGTIVREVTIK
jgi:hypothetical protein